nr:hypothetical protein 13 [Saccharospirillaceae bacterium]
MNKSAPIFLILLAILSLKSFAGVTLGGNTTVERVRMSNINYMIVYTNNQSRKASCSDTTSGFALELGDNKLGDRYYSAVLMALASNKVMNPWCPGNDQCVDAYGKSFTLCKEVSIE